MASIARFSLTALDCPDPRALAEFYAAITGWAIDNSEEEEDWVQLRSTEGATLAFQRVDNYRAPTWPEGDRPQQLHCDFDVADLDAAEAEIVAIGARRQIISREPHSGYFSTPPAIPSAWCWRHNGLFTMQGVGGA